MNAASDVRWVRGQRASMFVGLAGLAVCAVTAVRDQQQFVRSYLIGFLYWWELAVGCLGMLLLRYLTPGRWGPAVRPYLEAGAATMPLVAAMFLPLAAAVPLIYPWANPETVAHDPVLRGKALYLNEPFFLYRAAGYFAIWIVLALVANRWSEVAASFRRPPRKLRRLSAAGIILLVLTVTMASIDWGMSLEPHWYSTIYGGIYIAGSVLAALAMTIAALAYVNAPTAAEEPTMPEVLNDLGNLSLAFLMLWAYMSFSQYLIIWSGNLTEEIPWYLRRIDGGWQWCAVSMIVLGFIAPFVLFLSRDVKRDKRRVMALALMILAARLIDIYWTVAPAFSDRLTFHVSDIAAPIGLGGLWVGLFIQQLKRRLPDTVELSVVAKSV